MFSAPSLLVGKAICGPTGDETCIEEGNLRRAYSAYCVTHGLMAPDEVMELRNSYGLSLREFSKFLGFGEQTIARVAIRSLCGVVPLRSGEVEEPRSRDALCCY